MSWAHLVSSLKNVATIDSFRESLIKKRWLAVIGQIIYIIHYLAKHNLGNANRSDESCNGYHRHTRHKGKKLWPAKENNRFIWNKATTYSFSLIEILLVSNKKSFTQFVH
jgi:hypothetical protein